METSTPASLQEAPLRELIAANVVSGLAAVGQAGGFVLQIRFGDRSALLASSRGEPRVFASLSTLAALIQRLGVSRFEVDVGGFTPGRIRKAQPERSAAMKAGHLPRAAAQETNLPSASRTKK